MNNGKYISGKLMGENTLFWQYPQVQPNKTTIIKRKAIRKLLDNEKVVNGEVITIEDQSLDE